MVDTAAEMGEAVAHYEVVGSEHAVVGADLAERCLRDFYVGGFVLDNEAGASTA